MGSNKKSISFGARGWLLIIVLFFGFMMFQVFVVLIIFVHFMKQCYVSYPQGML